ncbi:MAG: DUF2804 domain-containing protein [Actinomycetota bacterium]|nr:DUF2804 domain-containing protein [Actinomycetota bacterium]
MRIIKKTPARLVEGGEVVGFGVFEQPFRELNLDEADIFRIKGKYARAINHFRLKEWQHFGIVHPRHYIGLVIFDAKLMSISFVYHFDRERLTMREHNHQAPPGTARLTETTWRGECSFEKRGYSLRIDNNLDRGRHDIHIDIAERRGLPAIRGEVSMLEDVSIYQPLVIVSPFAPNRPLYTHKNACPVEGRISIGGETIELQPDRDVCLLDEQKAFYPYRSFWRWMTFAGYSSPGSLIAANLCHNLIEKDEDYNENCYWIGGRIHLTGAARFGFSEADILGPWFINTTDGEVELEFHPQGERAERICVGPIMSDFHQPFGLFSGRLGKGDGNLVVKDLFGVCENHVTRY